MPIRGHHRRILLFLLAVLLPSLVLVAVGLRTIRQASELSRKRLEEDHRRRLAELRDVLLAGLERIRETPLDDSVVLVASIDETGRLAPPWEPGTAGSPAGRSSFDSRIEAGEILEFAGESPEAAASLYRQALETSREPAQEASARLLLARALRKSGRNDEARELYRRLLESPPGLVDEHGVPFFLYASAQLAGEERTLERLASEISIDRWWSPAAAYLLRDLVRQAPEPLRRKVDETVRRLEQVLSLEDHLPRLPRSSPGSPVWVPYGDELWLVSVGETLVAVRPERVLKGRNVAFFTGEEEGEPLGASFPSLKVTLPREDDSALQRQQWIQERLLSAALVLVIGLTLFASYLLWRDVRREVRLAEMRSHFVSSVSHELKTPLTSIRMFAETLRMGRVPEPRVQDEYLETIVHESERLTRLLDDVLDFSLLEQGKKTYRFRTVRLGDIVSAAVRTLEAPLAKQGFRLRVEMDSPEAQVRADADAMEQALLNLLTNAVKYSGESREIGLKGTTEDGHAVLQVSDRGVGIPDAEKARIFEKFYRVPSEENQRIPGAGLGLTLVERVAQAHGGEVSLESAPGRGSTFSIRIPLLPRERAEAEP